MRTKRYILQRWWATIVNLFKKFLQLGIDEESLVIDNGFDEDGSEIRVPANFLDDDVQETEEPFRNDTDELILEKSEGIWLPKKKPVEKEQEAELM
jgi:hypothetical protein